MVLNEPPIELSMLSSEERSSKCDLVEKFEFWMFNKNDYYCIDGFPREGYPCVVVLPPPYRQGYVYQGIKPAVIVLSDDKQDEELMEHVHVKQQAVLEKLKQKRASSLAGVNELAQTASEEESKVSINIQKVGVAKTSEDLQKAEEVLRQSPPKGSDKKERGVVLKADCPSREGGEKTTASETAARLETAEVC